MIRSLVLRIFLFLLILFALSCSQESQTTKSADPSSADTDQRALKRKVDVNRNEKRVALVIGNGDYKSAPLRNPVNDARAVAKSLRGLGFSVIELTNATQKNMKQAIDRFGKDIRNGGVGLFYYAGHGMQVEGRNYLIPVKANIESENDVEYESIDAGRVMAKMEDAGNRLNIVMLDACRNNPFARSFRSADKGLATVNAPRGTFIAYATAPGSVAADGDGANGVFTLELLEALKTEGAKIEDVFKQVVRGVGNKTSGKQVPWMSSSLDGDFYFRPPVETPALESAGGQDASALDEKPSAVMTDNLSSSDKIYYITAKGKTENMPFNGFGVDCDGYGAEGIKYSEQGMSITIPWGDVKYIIPGSGEAVLKNGSAIKTKGLKPSACKKAGVSQQVTRKVTIAGYKKTVEQEDRVNVSDMKALAFGPDEIGDASERLEAMRIEANYEGMVFVKGGCFQMGDQFGDGDSDEKPVHEVCLDDFYIDKTEVTQRAYRQQTGKSPSRFKGDDRPVELVSWHDAKAYCQKAGKRLPTEAEWEYAARSGGKKEKYAGTSGSPDAYAWYDKNSGKKTHPVAQKKPNGLGLYDMSGNVWEWVSDWYDKSYYASSPRNNPKGLSSGSYRVWRGGSWDFYYDHNIRASDRVRRNPFNRLNYGGFRCAGTP